MTESGSQLHAEMRRILHCQLTDYFTDLAFDMNWTPPQVQAKVDGLLASVDEAVANLVPVGSGV